MATKLPNVTSPPWGTNAKRIVSLIMLILFFLIARKVSGRAWSTIIIAMVLAYLLSPLVTFFEKRLDAIKSPGTRRTIAVLLSWLVMLAVMALILGLIIPAMLTQVRQLASDLPDLVQNFQGDLEKRLSKPIYVGDRVIIPWAEIQSAIGGGNGQDGQGGATQALQDRLLGLADSAVTTATSVLSFFLSLFIVLIMLFYLMRDGPNFVTYVSNSIPESYRGDFMRLLYELGKIWNSYLRGQMILNLAVGTATYIVVLILGLPNPLLLATLAGFLELIPNLGPTLALIPAFLLALISDSSTISSLDAGLGLCCYRGDRVHGHPAARGDLSGAAHHGQQPRPASLCGAGRHPDRGQPGWAAGRYFGGSGNGNPAPVWSLSARQAAR